MSDEIKKKASKMATGHPQSRAGIVVGLQFVRDNFRVDDNIKSLLEECINIIGGVSKYVERPKEIEDVEKEVEKEINGPDDNEDPPSSPPPDRGNRIPTPPPSPPPRRVRR